MTDHPLAAYLIRRLVAAVLLVAVVSLSTFALTRLAPGDPTAALRLEGAGAAAVARERVRLGLDRPLLAQMAGWAAGVARLDFGTSTTFRGQPVRDLVLARGLRTAELAAIALALGTLVGVPLGVVTGARPRGWAARLVAPVSVALVSCPPIVCVLALLWLAVVSGWMSTAPGHLALPVVALAAPLAATLERLQSRATREAAGGSDVVAGAARGLAPARLLWRHAARQALRPILGVYGILIGTLFSGSLIVEIVTAWPGLGRLMYDGIVGRDVFLVAGCAFAGAVCLAAGNLVADVARALADPRVREPS